MRGSAVLLAQPGDVSGFEHADKFTAALSRQHRMAMRKLRIDEGDSVVDLAGYRKALAEHRTDSNAATINRVARDGGLRRDAFDPNAGFHLARQLEHIHQQVLEEPFPVYNAYRLFPVDTSVPPGARSHTVRRVYYHGEARVHRGGGQDVPRSGVTQREQEFPVRHLVSSYGWDIFEAASSQFANSGLLTKLARGARDAIMELENRLFWFGAARHGLYGVTNYPWLPKRVVATPFTEAQVVSDAKAILRALHDLVNWPAENSKGVFGPNKLVTTKRLRNFLFDTPWGTNGDTTLGEHFLKSNSHIDAIEEAWELEDLGGTGIDGMLAYRNDQRGISLVVPQGITSLPAQALGFDNTVYSYSSIGGVIMPDVGNNILGYITTDAAP